MVESRLEWFQTDGYSTLVHDWQTLITFIRDPTEARGQVSIYRGSTPLMKSHMGVDLGRIGDVFAHSFENGTEISKHIKFVK